MKRLHRICALHAGASVAAWVLAAVASNAQAAVSISSQATQNMNCSGGVCAPTAKDAVLNVGDLETLLGSGNVSVTTTGSGVQAKDIDVRAALSWNTSSALTLDAWRSLAVDRKVSVQGPGGLTILTNDGGASGTLSFAKSGNVTFANLSSTLTINGVTYALVNTIKALASAIAGNPAGTYAFASSFDAGQDGTYTTVPIPTVFTGTFEGLGNAIYNLSINDANDIDVGLFAEIDSSGTLRDISVIHASILASACDACAAPLVSIINGGNVIRASASGSISAENSGGAGGLVCGDEFGTIMQASATTKASGVAAGGLFVRVLFGSVAQSFATGKVLGSEYAGGLGDVSASTISDSYATGDVVGSQLTTHVGGFASQIDEGAQVGDSYSTGKVKGGTWGDNGTRGGFVGWISFDVTFTDSYWDLDTSGVKHPWKGAGNRKWEPGITGLTTEQLQSGLPPGFDPAIWGEDPNINGGLPYLIANPPPH